MDSDLKDRVSSRPALRTMERAIAARSAAAHEVPLRKRANGNGAKRPPVQLIHEVSRVAGRFQRSAVGYLDHTDWHERMRSDGQHLIDLLSDMGFTPSSQT